MAKKKWTAQDDACLKALFGTFTATDLAMHLRCSTPEVSARIKYLGLRRRKTKPIYPKTSTRGFRESLGISVRSSWECNTLLMLTYQKIKWEYEPQMFWFNEIRTGSTAYLPDIKVYSTTDDYQWLEVKGRCTSQTRTKTRRFKKYYPEEFARLVAITKNAKAESTEFYLSMGVPIYAFYDDMNKKYKNIIKGWE